MKKILLSFAIITIVGTAVAGATGALFNDTETSNGNIFVAGAIDLTVDHTMATYDGQPCVGNCTETGGDLIVNGGFETPVVTDNGGLWQIYPSGITGWAVESGALELQRNSVAGAPHGGVQLVELDSTVPSSISQTIATTASGKYRLHFWYSPRPGNPSGDNGVGFQVQVVSPTSVILSDTVGSAQQGGSGTVWGEYVYDFIAVDALTKIIFTDLGSNTTNSMGGYIDDVSMFSLNCTGGGFPYGGQCHLWNEQNLGPTEQFWNFPDVKPGDYGTDLVSLHVNSNDAFACLYGNNIVDTDVSLTDPETSLADTLLAGELSPFLKVFAWNDTDNDGLYEGEATLIPVNTPLSNMALQMVALSLTGGGPTNYVGLAWCAGTQSLSSNVINCDGSSMGDIAQTDSTVLDLTAYAVQQRNNPNFSCASLVQVPN